MSAIGRFFTPGLAISALVLLAVTSSVTLKAQDMKKLTLKDVMRGGSAYRPTMPPVRWSPDGKSYSVGNDWFDLATGKPTEGPTREKRKSRSDKEKDSSTATTVIRHSPDGKWISEVKDWNLLVRPKIGGAPIAVTSDGSEELLYGILDWVYQEEVYGRYNFMGHWWSPDSKKIAFLKIDEEEVREFTVLDHIRPAPSSRDKAELRGGYPKNEITNYPKAGFPNPVAQLGVFDLESKKTVWFPMDAYEGQEPLIVKVSWTPDSSRVVFQVQNRIQNMLDLNYGDPALGKVTRILREESNGWVNVLGDPRWLEDGSFLWWSERSGYKHLYHYKADGELLNQVTKGPWEVRDLLDIDESEGRVWFMGARESAVAPHAYRVDLDGENLVHLTPERGTHSVSLNKDKTHLIDRFSSLDNPGKCYIRDMDGKLVRAVTTAKFEPKFAYSPAVLHRVKARDGFEMDVTVMKPHEFDESKSYPVLLMTYSGPNAPTIRDRFGVSAWQQFLLQEGIVILQCNNRSSSGGGQVTTEACYKQFGKTELEDLCDAVDWLCKNSWADASRVGITGWSYGGFMAAMALTKSKKFALGLAGAGVFDWRLYDTIYTERYMSTPQLNPEGYHDCSPINFTDDLHGRLVIMHGTIDDNVHLQNAIQFIYALQKSGKQFDLMLYPRQRHGVRERELREHLQAFKWAKIQKYLLKRTVSEG